MADLPSFAPTSRDAWETRIQADLKGRDRDRTLAWHLAEGIRLEPYHRADDLARLAHVLAGGVPRRAAPGWQRKQRARAEDAEAANAAARAALLDGADAIAFDLPAGAIDLRALFRGLDTSAAALHGSGAAFARALADHTEAHGTALEDVAGSLEADPLATLCRTGSLHPDAAYAGLADALGAAEAFGPGFFAVCADARPYAEAGADLAQEAACVLAALAEHLAQLEARGVSPALAASRAHLIVPVGTRFLPELAKLRALRILAPQVFAGFGAEDTPPIHLQAVTARRALTLADPHTNLLRATTAATCAVLAGCDTLEVTPFDALTSDSEQGRRLARTTQLLLAHEAHLGQDADPTAGAYSVEVLTDEIARAAWAGFQQIEAEGGMLAALQTGAVQARIAEARKNGEEAVRRKQRVIIGTSDFPLAGEVLAKPAAELRGPNVTGAPVVIAPLPRTRDAEPFEALRRRVQAQASAPPLAYCVPVGAPAMRAARAAFAQNLFAAAGFRTESPSGFGDATEGARAARDAGAAVAILCAPDDALPDAYPPFAEALEGSGILPLVAAPPSALPEARRATFVHRKIDAVAVLGEVLDRLPPVTS